MANFLSLIFFVERLRKHGKWRGLDMTVSYGKRKDGTLEKCRARPENRGKGRCFHGEHVDLSPVEERGVSAYNEKVLAEKYSTIPRPSGFTSHDLRVASEKIGDHFTTEDYEYFRRFENIYEQRLQDRELNERFSNATENIYDFLTSDDEVAVRTREFLGDDIDLSDFSQVLVSDVNSMTSIVKYHPKNGKIQRAVMSSVGNDMNKSRYIASVLFFRGRCCYCERPLRKRPPRHLQASGEHITPVAEYGGTKFGNVALCCVSCNQRRGNKKLEAFINSSSTIHDKPKVLARINEFRRFALYEEYNEEQKKEIETTIARLERYAHKKRNEEGFISRADMGRIQKAVDNEVAKLRHKLSLKGW